MKIPAVILARGGSKGIVGKNLRPVGGVPLIGRTVRECVRSKLDPVIVYSDDSMIRDVAQAYGAEIPVRPESAKVSGDEATSEATMKAWLDKADPKKRFEWVTLVQCTTPFLKARHLDAIYEKVIAGGLDSVVTATQASSRFFGYPGQNPKLQFIPMRPYRTRRQEGSLSLWMENGGAYCAKRKWWDSGRRMGPVTDVVPMGWWESLEIDEPEDLAVAERLRDFFDKEEESHSVKWIMED